MTPPIVSPTRSAIIQAAVVLKDGGLVAVPTETVYGLAALASDPVAVANLYSIKGRPTFNPLIAHIASVNMANEIADIDDTSRSLVEMFWPGPLTIVCPAKTVAAVCDLARAGLDSVAIRCPRSDITRSVIEALGEPIVAPSANRSGRISPTEPRHVASEFEDGVAMILDGGACSEGIESTVIRVVEKTVHILRPGAVTREALAGVVSDVRETTDGDDAPRSPGLLTRHYAPDAIVRLNVTEPNADEGYLGFGEHGAHSHSNLSATGSLQEAASNLYRMLRELDTRFDRIAVAPIPDGGLGRAINDRLRRASWKDG